MAKIEFQGKRVDPDTVWYDWFSGDAFRVDKRLRHIFHFLPRDPRCKFCNAPFQGIGGQIVRALYGKRQSDLNPRFCNMCDEAARRFPGGAEVEMSMLFADVRGSTALSETMSAREFSALINRFYINATRVITQEDGLVEKLAGDAVAAFWGAGFAGAGYVRRTLRAGQKLARVMAQENIPVGIGIHYGVAFFGVMGASKELVNISAIGDEVNTAARIASKAAAGEILVSEQALAKAGVNENELEARALDLKGISAPVRVRVLHQTSESSKLSEV